jgi:CTP synthase (UTP-ammonia lyase)
VTLRPGTRAATLYGVDAADESYYCNYGINPGWIDRLEGAGLGVSGVGEGGEPRIVELPGHPFFVATLFLPQARSSAAAPHPLLVGFAGAVAAHAEGRGAAGQRTRARTPTA